MRLSVESKRKLLDSANKVYLAYTALDFFKERKFSVSGSSATLYELCKKAIAENNLDQILVIDGVNYRLVLVPGPDNTFKVQFNRPLHAVAQSPVKTLSAYSDSEALALLETQEFSIEIPEPNSEHVVSNKINEQYVIGGKGKVDLYRTHLVTLHHIIEKISNEEDISNLLVALATGSGKTFVQALWMFILSLSENNGVFAVPDKLATQFVKDLKRLLPDSFVDSISLLRNDDSNPRAEALIQSLENEETTGVIIVGSSERLLDNHYQELLDADSQRTFLSFDEQHLIMKEERRRVRLIELCKQKLTMFLTATPNKETYELSGNRPVAIMSSGQKQEAGQGQFPQLITHQAQNISDRNKLKNYKFWTGEFWQNMLNGILLRLSNAIQTEHSSAATSLVEELPFYIHEKEDEDDPRWRIQAPAARKMLCIIDDNETLVNFCHSLRVEGNKRDVYHNGNIIDRSNIAGFFGIPDVDVSVLNQHMRDKLHAHQVSLNEKGVSDKYAYHSLAERLQSNIFHSLVEYVLTDITGLDEIEHNRLRKQDMNAFVALVQEKFQPKTAAYYQEKLSKLIDPEGAQVIGGLLENLSDIFNRMNHVAAKAFIDNWSLNDGLFDRCISIDGSFSYRFENYAKRHLMMGVMTGMKSSETAVAESRPFTGLTAETYNLYDDDGSLSQNVKKRQLTPLEILNDTSKETTFTPDYLNFSEETADNYFRLGFTGMYVSNKKTEGFSDRNLHTVINLAEHTLSATNSPETQIQGIGRNRGLDDTIQPTYIHSLGRKQSTVFSLDHLKSEDYYPELFKSQEKFNKQFTKILGAQVGQQVISFVHANLDKDETIHPDRLKRQVLKYIALALRDINNKNSHQITLSRAQLTKIVGYAMDHIDKEIQSINKPYKLSYFLKGLSSFLNAISEIYYAPQRMLTSAKIYYYSWFNERERVPSAEGQRHPDDVYIKILHKTSFKNIVAEGGKIREFRNWLDKKKGGIKAHVEKNMGDYLKKDAAETYSTHQKNFLTPLLMKLIVDSQHAKVAEAIAAFPQYMNFLQANFPKLQNLFENKSPDFEKEALKVFHQIPGLEDLTAADLINYPQKIANVTSIFGGETRVVLAHYPELKTIVSSQLTAFLKKDFITYLSAFMAYPQVQELERLLNQGTNAQAFVDQCVTKFIGGELQLDSEMILTELRTFFSPDKKIATLLEDKETLAKEFAALHDELNEESFEHLSDEVLDRLVFVIKNQLVPSLVNLYPLESRQKLLLEASEEKLKTLLVAHGKEILFAKDQCPQNVATLLFSKLHDDPLPAFINPDVEKDKLKNFFISELMKSSMIAANPASVADILNKEGFFNAIASFIPYTQWLEFKTKMQGDDAARLRIAKEILALGFNALRLPPEELIQLFNKELHTDYELTQNAAERAATSIKANISEMAKKPLSHLSKTMQTKLFPLIPDQLMPLLASFIKDDSKKIQFLATRPSPEVIQRFIENYGLTLQHMLAASGETLKENALTLMNQLTADGATLIAEDVVDPAAHAINTAESLTKVVQKNLIAAFLKSDTFRDLIKDSLNQEDYQLLITYINPEQVADGLMAREKLSFDKAVLFEFIKNSDPKLQNIELLDKRFEQLEEFMTDLKKTREKNLDKEKMAELIADFTTPVLCHKQFTNTVNKLIGFLDEQDLTVILEAHDTANPAADAQQLLRFLKLIKENDKDSLKREFMFNPEAYQNFDFDTLPLKHVVDNLEKIAREVIHCHCVYNNHDAKGEQGRATSPKIYNKLSPELRGIVVPSNDSFLSGFSRKVFYFQGIRNGLDEAAQVNAEANQHVAKILGRVKTHILRPLWWSTNISKASHTFIKGCRDVVYGVISVYYKAVNGVKSLANGITRSSHFALSSKNPDSHDYHETAHQFAEKINELNPLESEQVKQQECPPDVVVHLEQYVENLPARVGFFSSLGVPEQRDAVAENLQDDMEHSNSPSKRY